MRYLTVQYNSSTKSIYLSSMHRLAFSWTNIILLTVEGAREARFALIVKPAIENTRSDGALVAGIARTIWASLASRGNVDASLHHQAFKSSMPGVDRHLNCWISRSMLLLELACLASMSSLIFFHGGITSVSLACEISDAIPAGDLSSTTYLLNIWIKNCPPEMFRCSSACWTIARFRIDGSRMAAHKFRSVVGTLFSSESRMMRFNETTASWSFSFSLRDSSISALNKRIKPLVTYAAPLKTSVAVLKISKNSQSPSMLCHSSSEGILSYARRRCKHLSINSLLSRQLRRSVRQLFHLVGQSRFNVVNFRPGSVSTSCVSPFSVSSVCAICSFNSNSSLSLSIFSSIASVSIARASFSRKLDL